MSKQIKVSEEVFEIIREYQAKRETYSGVILRAFEAFIVLDKIKRGEYGLKERPEPAPCES